jgi:SAM-dependent methyltransferase
VDKHVLLDLLEAYHLAHVVKFLHRNGILNQLGALSDSAEIARRHGFDEKTFDLVLTYLAERSDLVQRGSDGAFSRGARYGDGAETARLVDQYLEAYGANVERLDLVFRDPYSAGSLVDRESHARAFAHVDTTAFVQDLVRRLGARAVLDIGCGPATALRKLAQGDRELCGWGLDASPAMHALGKRLVKEAGLEQQVTLLLGDFRHVGTVVPREIHDRVDLITASSLLNEMFIDGPGAATGWLKDLGSLFPGRRMLIADYYGQLGQGIGCVPRLGLLHDFVQAISGQGVPPAGFPEWAAIYEDAACTLVDRLEGSDGGFRWYVHLLRLPVRN